jgi:hypothetical protein
MLLLSSQLSRHSRSQLRKRSWIDPLRRSFSALVPRDCPPTVGNNGPPSNETGSRSLSDQLSQSKGVICPPAGIDPGISVPPSTDAAS